MYKKEFSGEGGAGVTKETPKKYLIPLKQTNTQLTFHCLQSVQESEFIAG